MRRFILLASAMIICILMCLAIVACDSHVHSFSDEWIYDDAYHWQCCIGCDETRNKSSHSWDDGVVVTQNEGSVMAYTCQICEKIETEPISKIPTYSVWFLDDNGNDIIPVQTVQHGQEATLPTVEQIPTKGGFRFDKWSENVNRIVKDTIVVAQYVRTFVVEFVDFDNSVISTQVVDKGDSAVAPITPQREGYRFIGWNVSFNNVQEYLEVKAQYSRVYNVRFFDWDGTLLSSQIVDKGKDAVDPTLAEMPTRVGYKFAKWNNELYKNVQSDVEIVAQYTINVYDVKFLMPNGDEIETQKVIYGGNAYYPEVKDTYFNWQTRNGYYFTGWSDECDNVTSNLEIVAIYGLQIEAPMLVINAQRYHSLQDGITIANVEICLFGNVSILGLEISIGFDESLVLKDVIAGADLQSIGSNIDNNNSTLKLNGSVGGDALSASKGIVIASLTFEFDAILDSGEYWIEFLEGIKLIDKNILPIEESEIIVFADYIAKV